MMSQSSVRLLFISVALLNFNANGIRLATSMVEDDCKPSEGTWKKLLKNSTKHSWTPVSYVREWNPSGLLNKALDGGKAFKKLTTYMQYEWVPTKAAESNRTKCELVKMELETFCAFMEKRGLTEFMVVGDASNWQMATSFWKLLEKEGFGPEDHPHRALGPIECPQGKVNFKFWGDDNLAVNLHTKKCSGGDCYPWYKEYLPLRKQTLLLADMGMETLYPKVHETFKKRGTYIKLAREDVNQTDEGEIVSEKLVNDTKAKLQKDFDQFIKLMERSEPGLLVYRTSAPGHSQCGEYLVPFDRYKEFSRNLYYFESEYQWGVTNSFNAYVKDQFPKKDNYMLLDVHPMSVMRADARFSSGSDNSNCLKWKQPGVPDWWNHLLITQLQRLK